MPDYFGMFRIRKDQDRSVTCSDGTTVELPVVSNPIESWKPNVRVNDSRVGGFDRKLTKKLANELWDKDKEHPFLQRDPGIG